MDWSAHTKASIDVLGKDCKDVHIWLDECYDHYSLGGKNEHYGATEYHHIERHHKAALVVKYGKTSFEYKVGCLHVLIDFISHYGVAKVPSNGVECLQIINKHFRR